MSVRINPIYHNNFVDANFWDKSDNQRDNDATLRILQLENNEQITLILPFSVRAEIKHPHTPAWIQRQALRMICTEAVNLSPPELALRAQLMALIQGNAKPGTHRQDVLHLFEAARYGGGYFITKEKRLLRKRGAVAQLLPSLRIVSPSEFVVYLSSGGVEKEVW